MRGGVGSRLYRGEVSFAISCLPRQWGPSARHTRSGISPARPTMLYKPRTGAAKSMTYCGGILVREGLVMFADTRTNAGVDNISTFRKLHVFKDPKKRVMAIASAGNLSISQSVVSTLTEGYDNPETGEHETLMNAPTLFQAARRVGHVVRTIHATEGKALESSDVTFDVSFLFGGQIMGERMRLFMIYSAGNFIECTVDTPYLQIGEVKYGKPVLDRAINYEMDIYDALKVGLISIELDAAIEPVCRFADRSHGAAPRHLRPGTDLPDRPGSLFQRSARALVGRVACGPYRHIPAVLRQPALRPIGGTTSGCVYERKSGLAPAASVAGQLRARWPLRRRRDRRTAAIRSAATAASPPEPTPTTPVWTLPDGHLVIGP